MHYCSKEELEAFHSPAGNSEAILEDLKSSTNRPLFCIDWDRFGDELTIWGT